ncbi:hypothetical protein MLD38_020966 [Melastoma candidum]|uniref:Uncharacterized protein n=1 Tax=Melastoma candidum TaxID=119954 RepID=A0ACB9QEX0_9MYRT|nr:hypothetical protein MLD38_020966 [Melastoma candidum]
MGHKGADTNEDDSNGHLSEPLLTKLDDNEDPGHETALGSDSVTPFAVLGFFSVLSFQWLSTLLRKGRLQTLQDEDLPRLRPQERAETCYSMFSSRLRKRNGKELYDFASVIWAIFYCEWKDIAVSGFYAMIKVLALSTGPLFLGAFIRVGQGNVRFENEGYVLVLGLFMLKSLESISERQWSFRTRLIGLRIRSFLSAAICRKQLRLSNAAREAHSPGEIVNYLISDVDRLGEFPFWFHQIWTTSLQLSLALVIIYYSIGMATFAALIVIILTVLASSPMAKLQHKYQTQLSGAQDKRMRAMAESLASMKVLKLYAWETHFRDAIENLRRGESEWIRAILSQKGYYMVLYWSSPILVPAVTFWVCYLLGIPLSASTVFMFLASLRIVQEPIRLVPDVVGVFIQAKVSFSRIIVFLQELELENEGQKISSTQDSGVSLLVECTEASWNTNTSGGSTLRNIRLSNRPGEKVAVCGEVGSGKSTLLALILGEVPHVDGKVRVCGRIAYVSQTAWIQSGTIQENILFGSRMDFARYEQVIEKCSLRKDIAMLPFGDQTQIGEKGVNLSGGQKQRLQLARALYRDADIYLLDDPFSAVDASTTTSLFNDYVMEALKGKMVLLVTHQVDFLRAFDYILLMSSGKIVNSGMYDELIASCQVFRELVYAHTLHSHSENRILTASSLRPTDVPEDFQKMYTSNKMTSGRARDQLIKPEEREKGDAGLKPYLQYLNHKKGVFYFSMTIICHTMFVVGILVQNYWMAAKVDNARISHVKLNLVYTEIGAALALFLLIRSFIIVIYGCGSSESIFTRLLHSLFRAPISFYDSTPLGRILSRVSSDLGIVDVELAFKLAIAVGSSINTWFSYLALAIFTWPVVFVLVPMIYLTLVTQRYYLASANELMRLDRTTKSSLASHLTESISGEIMIRAFGEEDRFFSESLHLINANASCYFHSFSANEWLILRLDMLCTVVLTSSALAIIMLDLGPSASGYIGMALSYGLSLNVFLVVSVQFLNQLSNMIISVERLEQYLHIPSEAPEVIQGKRPPQNWPDTGLVEICDLKVRYRENAPFVIRGISCRIRGGEKVGIVGRTGSGKSTLIGALFRLVEHAGGRIIIDGVDISTIGIHDLRSNVSVIPQDPTLFSGTVRYNLDPLSQYNDEEIWEVLAKCQLQEIIRGKEKGLDSPVLQEGSNWSVGQRQLFCLGRVLLKRSRILVLDEATASVDNMTDLILQRTIREEFAESTVITVAHRVPTVMECDMVMAISDGRLVEYDSPGELLKREDSLFGQLYKEYWSRAST